MKRGSIVAVCIVSAGSLGIGTLLGERRVEQPYPFNHEAHTRAADCTLCHQNVRSGERAGLPGLKLCLGCHATAPGKEPSPEEQALWKGALHEQYPRWNRLFRLPPHVYFSHLRHVTIARIECARCHGDMQHRKQPPEQALQQLRMRDCIDCHQRERVTVDCTACHR